MSAETIARWNSIPESWPTNQGILKRTRDDLDGDADDDDDDVSLVSRSPSPERMDVDAQDLDKYDEYARGVEKEVITVDTKINSSNVGFSMLRKLGWVEGQPLGISGDGRVDPIPFCVKRDLTGLGKTSEDARMIESTVSQRRELDSERQQKETEEQRLARENIVARQATIQSELSETLKAFYCSVCDKQFIKVAQYDEHCNSYSHHHKIRFRDMQAAQRAKNNSQEAIDKRKEKERKREEKELRKVAKAAGVKIAAAVPVALPVTPAVQASATVPPDSASNDGFKSSGWASVVPEASASASTSGGFRKSGWSTVDSSPAEPPPPPPQAPAPSPPSLPIETHVPLASFSGFRSGGWTSLESSPSFSELQQREVVAQPMIVSDSSAPPSQSNYAPINANPSAQEGWSTLAALPPANSPNAPSSLAVPPSAKPSNQTSHSSPPRAEAARSGWQNFKRGGVGSRR